MIYNFIFAGWSDAFDACYCKKNGRKSHEDHFFKLAAYEIWSLGLRPKKIFYAGIFKVYGENGVKFAPVFPGTLKIPEKRQTGCERLLH